MKKFLKLLVVTGLVGSMLVGCAAKDQTTSSKAESGTEQKESKVLTIKHALGETDVTTNPKKVVVLDMGVLQTMDQLGIDVEVATTTKSLLTTLDGYKSSFDVGTLTEPNLEKIYEFNPDLIISSGRQSAFYDQLSEIAPTWHLTIDTKNIIEDIKTKYTTLGQVFDKESEVKSLISEVESNVKEVAALGEALEGKGLIMLANDGKISGYGTGSRFGIIHDVFNIKPVDETIQVTTHGQEINYEYIAKMNPDILFVVDRAAVVGGSAFANDMLNNDLVKSTNAFKNNKIVQLDPQTWYVAGNSLSTIKQMVEDIGAALK